MVLNDKGGSIVNITSVSKARLDLATKVFALELSGPSKVRVNAIASTSVITKLLNQS